MRLLPRLRSARLAAELAEVRDRAERAETEACCAADQIAAVFRLMEGHAAAAGLRRPPAAAPPAPRPQRHLSLVSDDRPGAA